MRNVPDSVETVNAAASAIVTAETRVQPFAEQKRRWGNCWSISWCFGSSKQSKRIGHAVLVSEPNVAGIVAPIVENQNRTPTILLPFIAPPSSPSSVLRSDPSSALQSPPGGLLSLKSLSVGTPSVDGTTIFTVGPYAHETQLVSPPAFSAFTTEPSTASFTPPPEPVQMTSPSSPEVPFAQLLSSSLAQSGRRSGVNLKDSLSQYEFKPYHYPGSPGALIKSPSSVFSNSGTSSPFPAMEFQNYKWGSRVGSGSLTPNGGSVSRLESGNLTPNDRLSSLGSGTLTPNGGHLPLFPNSVQNDDLMVHHRVSFELLGEDIPTSVVREPTGYTKYAFADRLNGIPDGANNSTANANDPQNALRMHQEEEEDDDSHEKHRTISFGSLKDFHFSNAAEDVAEKSNIDCDWWTQENTVEEEWNFFPVLQSSAS